MTNVGCRKGFVLVMTLVIIAISGLLLMGIAHHSLNLVAESVSFQRRLQIKWGSASCQRYVIENAEELLTEYILIAGQEQPVARAVPESRCSLYLGDFAFEIVAIDESAKLNINLLATRRSDAETASIVQGLSGEPWTVELQPLPAGRSRDSKEGEFECWEQVFVIPDEFRMDDLSQATRHITCWGAKIHLQSISDPALLEAAELYVGAADAQKLVELRGKNPAAKVETLLAQLSATTGGVDGLRQILSDRLSTQSVLVHVRGEGEDETTLLVRESFGQNVDRYAAFSW